MSKKDKALPMLLIIDENDGSEKRFVGRSYVETALQGILLTALQEPKKVIEKIESQIKEISLPI